MKLALLLLVVTQAAQCAMIHGIVLERTSSRPLARSRVTLQILNSQGTPQNVATAFTNRSGQYWFPSLPDGDYLVSAGRQGYLETVYGQKRPFGAGSLIPVKGDAVAFIEIRMFHLGAISGTVFDENQVGLMGVNVIAYHAKIPLSMVSSTKTDDRGRYRIGLLPPGRYWVRTGPLELEDGAGILPTFFPGSTTTQEAKIVRVDADADSTDIDFQPLLGKLFRLTGRVPCPPEERFIRVTLSTDTGRKETNAPCPFGDYTFDQLAPGNYELLAEPVQRTEAGAAWEERLLDRDGVANLQLAPFPGLGIASEVDGNNRLTAPVNVLLRRKDPAGVTHTSNVPGRLMPGIWEIFVRPPDGHALIRFTAPSYINRSDRNENAPMVKLETSRAAGVGLRFTSRAGTIEGVVKSSGDIVPQAPVYLYPIDATIRRLVHGVRNTHSDTAGKFRFTGLSPGQYLVLSSFDMEEVTSNTMEDARATLLTVSEGSTKSVALDLYVR
jgi:hypothetical protein